MESSEYRKAWTAGYEHGLAQCNHHHGNPVKITPDDLTQEDNAQVVADIYQALEGKEWDSDAWQAIDDAYQRVGITFHSPDSLETSP